MTTLHWTDTRLEVHRVVGASPALTAPRRGGATGGRTDEAPVAAARHAAAALTPDGTVMLIEPFANDRVEDNLNPVGRMFYSASTMICTPASKAQEVGLALGAQAGEARLREVVTKGGFTRFRRATQTPFNLVFEARP